MAGHGVATDSLPSAETQLQVADFPVFDREGKELPFSDVYNGRNATDRTLVVFVRHFFCGSCQEYLERLSATITPNLLSQSPTSTSVAVVGFGDYRLIDFYAEQSRCPFPIYSDPTRKLHDALGMINTWEVGQQPGYISKSLPRLAVEGMWQALKQLPNGLAFKNGPAQQEGGEFLFEPTGEGDKRVTWCHRMQNSWGHTEIPAVSRVLLGHEAAKTDRVVGGRSDNTGSRINWVLISGVVVASFALYKGYVSNDRVWNVTVKGLT